VRGVFSGAPEFLALSDSKLVRLGAGGTSSQLVLDASGQGLLSEASLAPSERWIAFTLARPDGTAALFLASVSEPTPGATWARIDESRVYLGSPTWSSDGRILYYGSARDGFVCTWAQRVSADGRPEGAPFAARHHHTMPSMLIYGMSRISAGGDRLYMLLSDFAGDLWSLTLRR
jgi:hypothetical protein